MKGKRFIKVLCITSMIAMLVSGCDFLDKVEGGIDNATEVVDQLERIEEKATDFFE